MTLDLPAATDLSTDEQIALLSGGDFWHTRPLPERGVPSATLSDGPHGLRFQGSDVDHLGVAGSEPATCFPPAVTLASSWDPALLEEVGAAVAAEALEIGVDVILGPGLNIKRHPLCGRNFEYLSEDPHLAGRLAAAIVRGIQSRGVGACLKHFAVNNQESHRFVVDAVLDERTLRELYLSGFEYAVRTAHPWTVMTAYNSVNGTLASQHSHLIADLLRDAWGFDGLVMSDWGAVGDRVAGVAAGMDIEMPGSHGLFDADVRAALAAGDLSPDDVAASAQRVLDLVRRSRRSAEGSLAAATIDAHDALVRRAAAEGTVLLANDGTLPLRTGQTVALIGAFAEHPRYQGSGSSLVNPTRVTTALDALRGRGVDVAYVAAYDPQDPDVAPDLAGAVAAAREADVAVVMAGLPEIAESEGFDRATLALPASHDALVAAVAAANPRTVVALSQGAPVLLPWAADVAAILESYLGGQAGGGALVDVLYGDVNPGGRLAETFPASQDDVAADPWFPGAPRQVEYREGLFVGYRHHTAAGLAPLFPFGHGLGYTTTSWGEPALSVTSLSATDLDAGAVDATALTVTLDVTNTGEVAGSDVVQAYLQDRTGVVLRPRRELAGFAKVRLVPGETATVTIPVAARAFAFFDVDAGGWRIPAGAFAVEVARSSADVVASLPVEVTGGVSSSPEPADTPAIAATDGDFTRRLGRPIPTPAPARPFTRGSTMAELTTTRLGSLIRNTLWRLGPSDTEGQSPARQAMLERSFDELPLRAAAIFSEGRLRWPVVDTLLDLLNGEPLRAGRRALGGAADVVRRLLPRR